MKTPDKQTTFVPVPSTSGIITNPPSTITIPDKQPETSSEPTEIPTSNSSNVSNV